MRKFTATALTAVLVTGLSFGALAQGMSSSPSEPSSPSSSSRGTVTPANPSSSGAMAPSSSEGTMKRPVASASQVRSALQSQGYTGVKSIKKSGTNWTATAMKDGKSVHVAVDEHGNVETR